MDPKKAASLEAGRRRLEEFKRARAAKFGQADAPSAQTAVQSDGGSAPAQTTTQTLVQEATPTVPPAPPPTATQQVGASTHQPLATFQPAAAGPFGVFQAANSNVNEPVPLPKQTVAPSTQLSSTTSAHTVQSSSRESHVAPAGAGDSESVRLLLEKRLEEALAEVSGVYCEYFVHGIALSRSEASAVTDSSELW